jgi:hypothetical protein
VLNRELEEKLMQAALEAQKQNDLISTYEKQLENSRSQISMMEEQSSLQPRGG